MPIMAMDKQQAEIFQLFVELGPGRTTNKLLAVTEKMGLPVTLRQIRRWSEQWKWHTIADQQSHAVAARVEEAMVEDSVARNKKLISAYRKLQDRFIKKLEIEPDDMTLSEEKRAMAFDPDFKDFVESVKGERLILGDPTERREDITTSRLVVELGESELLEAARAIASKRYGLPTPADIQKITDRNALPEPETYEAEVEA